MVSPHHGVMCKFLDSTVNSATYNVILSTTVIPLLLERRNRNLMYQQDGAPAHYATGNRDLLDEKIPNRWIGRGGPIAWPARSPDLSVLDFWMWGDIRHKLYRHPRPTTLVELKEKLANLLRSVTLDTVRKAYDSSIRRCELCADCKGGHFEQFFL